MLQRKMYTITFAGMSILIQDYTYKLPNDRIALFPLKERDQSRLLFYNQGKIQHYRFADLPDLLPQKSFLFFNDTRVIPARMIFKKITGAEIEVFLLDPVKPSPVMAEAMLAKGTCTWQCTVGNLKRWTDGLVLKKETDGTVIEARILDREKGLVEFSWTSSRSFSEVITNAGQTPLPPYLNRTAEPGDRDRYQTIFAHYEGAVAAPTAGLHFTNRVLENLHIKNIGYDFLTLHVGAGTFQPVKAQRAQDHIMHNEKIMVTRKNIETLLDGTKFIIAVGTTSMRTLESVYWYGVKLIEKRGKDFTITQDDPYHANRILPARVNAVAAVLDFMKEGNLDVLYGNTSIYIMPGYNFRICQGLITNFHQPGSTLLLLVAAFLGDDWKKVYNEALNMDYRFLSYGDSSLLIPK
jgi:S-adenosylmethionine:tRNA ribosyltransferase-isomerase